MMQYDFDRPIDRWNNFATKYDEMEQKFGRRDLLPMWIADMDLMTAQPILDAIDARNRQGIFGYTSRPDSYFQAVCDWQEKRHAGSPPRSSACSAWAWCPRCAPACANSPSRGTRCCS